MRFGRHCCVSAVLLLACSLSWAVAVDQTSGVGAPSVSASLEDGTGLPLRTLMLELTDESASIEGEWRKTDSDAALRSRIGRSLASAEVLTGTWEEAAPIPTERTMGEVSAGVLTLEGKAYMLVVGEAPIASDNTATLIYDFTEDVWLIGAPRQFVGNHHASEVIGNKMYLFGGLTTGNHTIQIASLVDATQGVDVEWSLGADLPVPSGSGISSLIDGLVYYCGGIDANNTFTFDACYIYDPASDTWSSSTAVAPMPEGRNHAAACTDGEKMYVFGGRMGYNDVLEGFDDTQIFTPGEGWSEGTPLPLARGGMGKAVYYNGECYVFGGEVEASIAPSPDTKVSTSRTVYRVDVYSPSTDSWREATEMPTGLHGVFPVLYEDDIHMAGGGTQAAYSQSTLHFRFTPGTDASRGVGVDASSAAAPSPAVFGSSAAAPMVAAPTPAPVSSIAAPVPTRVAVPMAAAPATASPPKGSFAGAPRSFVGSATAPEPAADGSSATLAGTPQNPPVSPGHQRHVLDMDVSAQLPAWLASVFVSIVAYQLW